MRKLLFYLFPPKRIEIVLCNRDFAESGEFRDHSRCPLATAFKRTTGIQPSVSVIFVHFGYNRYKIKGEFNYSDYLGLKERCDSGETINHKITLIKQ